MKLKHCGTCATEVSIEDYFSSFVVEMERRGDVQNKIKEKERVSLKARGMSEPAFASSLPRFRARDVRFLVYFIIVLFLSFC